MCYLVNITITYYKISNNKYLYSEEHGTAVHPDLLESCPGDEGCGVGSEGARVGAAEEVRKCQVS